MVYKGNDEIVKIVKKTIKELNTYCESNNLERLKVLREFLKTMCNMIYGINAIKFLKGDDLQ